MTGTVLRWSAFLFGLFHVYVNVFGALSELWLSALHFGGFGALCALSFHRAERPRRGTGRRIAAAALALLALSVPAYLLLMEDALYARGSDFIATDYLFAGLAVLLAGEFARRTTGWFMPILMALSAAYILFLGRYVSGVFMFPGLNLETFLYRVYFGGDGMFGLIANISATYVFMFILFGAFLMKSGGAAFITAFAQSVGRRMAGGAGVVAVVSSGMMGSIAGSAVANTASTGVITIPMMKHSGFTPRLAAGIEAAASTGGQLMPPVMGAGAFIMANYTQVSYLTVIAVSLLPALLYFLSVAYVVRIEARRLDLAPADVPEAAESEGGLLKKGWPLLASIAVLVGFLVAGYTPIRSVFFAILAVIVTSWFTKTPMTPRRSFDAVVDGVKMLLPTAILLVAVGLVVNVVTTTGLGNAFSLMIVEWSGGNLLAAIALIALASLILGMGLPVTASYIVLATLAAPILFDLLTRDAMLAALTQPDLPGNATATLELFGGDALKALQDMPLEMKQLLRQELLSPEFLSATLLAAHLVIFWLSQDSNVTPPVCLTAFTAAGIAGTKPMSTGIAAWKAAKGLYVVPLLFAYSPLITGDWGERLAVFAWSALGLYALAGLVQWHLEARLNALTAGMLALAAFLLLWAPLAVYLHAAGALLLVGVFVLQRRTGAPQAS